MAPSQGVNVLRRNGSQVRPDTPPTDSDTEPELEDVVKPRTVPVGSHFTARAIAVGSLIGILNAFSNTYFGLQTGWISGMAMPSALIGFASFRAVAPYLNLPFSPVENVLVQSVAGAVGTMPLGCGFVGVVPALEFLLKPSETLDGSSGYRLSLPRLLVWALGICFFGVVFGVPLRKELVIREKLKFPSGKATALMIGVLHGVDDTDLVDAKDTTVRKRHVRKSSHATDEQATLLAQPVQSSRAQDGEANAPSDMVHVKDWKSRIRLMTLAFTGSAVYVCFSIALQMQSYFPLSIRSWQIDRLYLLCSTISQPADPRVSPRQDLGMDTQSQPCICRPRYHHGSCHSTTYAHRLRHRLGPAVSSRQVPRLGFRAR